MGTTLALCGAVAGWCVMVLVSRRRLAVLRVRCDDAEAERAKKPGPGHWLDAFGGGRPESSAEVNHDAIRPRTHDVRYDGERGAAS